MKNILYIIVCGYLLHFALADGFLPKNGAALNYTQIQFKWPQINGYDKYRLIIPNDPWTWTFDSKYNSIIIHVGYWMTGQLWGGDIVWQVCAIDENEEVTSVCYDEKTFSLNSLPNNYPLIDSYPDSAYQSEYDFYLDISKREPGITISDFESLGFSVALTGGNPIWFSDRTQFSYPYPKVQVTEVLNNGNFLGYGNGKGFEFTLDSEVVFETPSSYGVHHDIHKTDRGTYFLIDAYIQGHPCPDECGPNLPEVIAWQGDQFVEIDANGDLVWDWKTFDYLSLDEYNPDWIDEVFDWTHSNSVHYDPITDMVYISMRNLSRISAINYITKEIAWNLGDPDFMDEVFFDNDFGFSHQHSAQITQNGNVLFFDNGRDNEPQVSRCLEIQFKDDSEPELVWEYVLPDSLLSLSRGECDRLPNNNTLITAGRTGHIVEVTDDGEMVWGIQVDDANGNDVSIYRSERVPSLYPNAFTLEIDNLNGVYPNYTLSDSYIDLQLTNLGYLEQRYDIHILNDNNQIFLSDNIVLSACELPPGGTNWILFNWSDCNTENISFDVSNLNGLYTVRVFPHNNNNKYQDITFMINETLGDINQDGLVNILDAVLLVNIILDNDVTDMSSDVNNDGAVNILDIVTLIGIILDS